MVRVAVIGGTGYTARELLRLLARHPHADVVMVTSRGQVGHALDKVHPVLKNQYELTLEKADPQTISERAEFVFCCLPHAASAELVCQLDPMPKTVDFSADYRLNDLATYEAWYETTHPQPEKVGAVAYGLPELFRQQIRSAALVANPGCFPTSVILALAPLIQHGLIETSDIIVDSKTGVTGAGRNPKLRFHFPESNENVAAYSVGKHRHLPEMTQIIQRKTGVVPSITFTPHLVPMNQGILSTLYVRLESGHSAGAIRDCWQDHYGGEPFVRIVDEPPATADVQNTNYCDLWCHQSEGRAVLVAAIDNLIKGASGAAVQNFNLMNGFEETLGLS